MDTTRAAWIIDGERHHIVRVTTADSDTYYVDGEAVDRSHPILDRARRHPRNPLEDDSPRSEPA